MMSIDQVAHYQELLIAMREALQRTADSTKDDTKPVELDQARFGRLSRMGDLQDQAMASALSRRRGVQLERIAAALERIDEGNYGVCLKCSNPIPTERLDFDPTAFFCPECAKQTERPRKDSQ